MDDTAFGEMNNVTTVQPAAPTILQDAMASSVSPQPSPRLNLPPPPNPPFSFPARPSSSAPSSLSRTTGRRHQSAIDIPKIGMGIDPPDSNRPWGALPDFSFNPGNSAPENTNRRSRPPPLPSFSFNPGATPAADPTLLSPSFPLPSPRTSPNHMGHRRGGSEFVGGKLKTGEPITLMSTSPTKSESGFASPTLTPTTNPRRHQRGHSHRRSGAISSHDLSLILQSQPNTSSRGSSAPTSPAGFRDQYSFPNVDGQKVVDGDVQGTSEATSAEGVRVPDVIPEKPSQSMPELGPKPVTRARVGFSDTLEFIPRPLSLVSTDTASTVRPGHSVSGSISSIASITNPMNPDRDSTANVGSPASRTKASSRPSTANAILERTASLQGDAEGSMSPRRRNSMLILNELAEGIATAPPSGVSTPTRTPKRWTFFGFDSRAAAGSPTKPRPASTIYAGTAADGESNLPVTTGNLNVAPQDPGSQQDAPPIEEKKKSSKKRQKRVKTWAGSILTRKSKSRSQKTKTRRRSQTPPVTRFAGDELSGFEAASFQDQSFGAETRTISHPSVSKSRKGKHREGRHEDEISYPMIDLDAALGPFNTPTRDPQWDEAQKAGAPPKRQLHSAAGMRGFSGPGMHYHRRAESAPEMPPFEGGRFSIHRFGSSSTMADVFEEDEEDEDDDSHSGESTAEDSSESQSTTTGDEDEGRDTDDAASTPTQERGAILAKSADVPVEGLGIRKGSRSSLPASGRMSNATTSSSSLHGDAVSLEPTFAMATTSSSETPDPVLVSPRWEHQTECPPPDATSIVVPGPSLTPISPYSIGQSSSFPSPRSPMSYDAHRISTAPSSITDENQYHSLLMGEPGPEVVRLSIDVPPSVISTNSTTTRESFFPGIRPRNMPFHEQRPASFTTSAFGRRRSSLASLSRLISSAHGERSKLSMEVPFDNEAEKKSKTSKSKRLTRLMQFWKPKASSNS
ncbi:hypothetical protein F4808DRAFT_336888 [Astrocystis sublimbata]|nr:hypothetical protein F4808DRAFT_336888 [Astrocystis sublimbata]